MSDFLKFCEFFCGGGMARAGLGPLWQCVFANDIDEKKAVSYRANWGGNELKIADVSKVSIKDIHGKADLAWASFPCQDLSLAGMGAGLKGKRSGTFWPFWKIIQDLNKNDVQPKVIVLENVYGALTSHGGKDFTAISKALRNEGYLFGAVIVDAAYFVPQSRPRLFIIGVKAGNVAGVPQLTQVSPDSKWHPEALVKAYSLLDKTTKSSWLWWKLPHIHSRTQNLIDILEEEPKGVDWHSPKETERILNLMTDVNLQKVKLAQQKNKLVVGAIYRRTRRDEDGIKRQRAEVRFDNTAGCLRTPTGGSSRQILMIIEGENVRSRLLSPREAARLMGLPDSYQLPANYNEAYHLLGDGLVVPVVNFLAVNILEPLLQQNRNNKKAA